MSSSLDMTPYPYVIHYYSGTAVGIPGAMPTEVGSGENRALKPGREKAEKRRGGGVLQVIFARLFIIKTSLLLATLS